MLELLSPAGSMEALRAAVQNGADAVYLGADGFNARAGARNFARDELPGAVSYCHVRGVKVHLTLNTLVSDREFPAAAELIRAAAAAGVDAFIVQDLGIIDLCKRIAPEIPLHGSTQMTVHSLPGVLECARMGLKRVVLSRELPRTEIANICRHSPIEIEAFGHGALCMCYSGQCYFSAVVGRRSGNRGACAQPCRMAYGYGRFEQRHPLSLKDNCLLPYVRDLEALGVASLKLEGRMKRAEYVAIVTRAYRTALDGGTPDYAAVLAAFNRQGFTDGYYQGKTGPEMFGIHEETSEPRELFASARRTYESGEAQRVPVRFYAIVSASRPLSLAVEDMEGRVCKATGELPQAALTHAITTEELADRLSKTGGTPYEMIDCRAVVEPGLSVPAAAINSLRREVLTALTALRGRAPALHVQDYHPLPAVPNGTDAPHLTVSVQSAQQVTPALRASAPAVLYAPLSELAAHPEAFSNLPAGTELCAVLPRVVWDAELPEQLRRIDRARAIGAASVLCGNLGQLELCRSRGFAVRGDFGLNVFNSRALAVLAGMGLASATLSFELTLPQIRDISKRIPCEILVYGRLPLMLTENCVIRARMGNCSCSGATNLTDRRGEHFPIQRDQDTCRNVILNGKKLNLLDKKRTLAGLGLWGARIVFTTENPTEVDAVLQGWHARGEFDPGSDTRGLYQRGVE